MRPLLTVSFGQTASSEDSGFAEDNYMYSTTVLPDYVIMNVNLQGRSVMKDGVRRINVEPLPGVILDCRTGEVSLREVVNDLMDGSAGCGFTDGYFVRAYDAAGFMETGRAALESGNLSEAARSRISAILKNLSDNDNDVILIAPLR